MHYNTPTEAVNKFNIGDIISPKQFLGYYYKIRNTKLNKITKKVKVSYLESKFKSKDEAWEFLETIPNSSNYDNFHRIVKSKEKILI